MLTQVCGVDGESRNQLSSSFIHDCGDTCWLRSDKAVQQKNVHIQIKVQKILHFYNVQFTHLRIKSFVVVKKR